MKKTPADLVKSTINLHEEMNNLTVDKIAETPVVETEPAKINYKKMAQDEGVQYIEPKTRLPAFGTLPASMKKQRDRDWEYVKGIYENYEINGEPVKFWFSLYPGDHDCLWEVPTNKPVYVPRMIARHLSGEPDPMTKSSALQYHTFGYNDRPQQEWKPDTFTHEFSVTGTHSRGKFRALEAFA